MMKHRVSFLRLVLILFFLTSINCMAANAIVEYTEIPLVDFFPNQPGSPFAYTWNITNTHGIPPNATAEILLMNTDELAGHNINVQNYHGDVFTQKNTIPLHEAEGGGNTTALMLVKVNEDGNIYYFQAGPEAPYLHYMPVGYFTGIDYTENNQLLSAGLGNDGVWVDKLVNPSSITVTNKTIFGNSFNPNQGAATIIGVRQVGSSLSRYTSLHEAEGGMSTHNPYFVNTNGTGYIQLYVNPVLSPPSTGTFQVYGYFNETIYTELFQRFDVTTSSTWVDHDLSAYIGLDGQTTSWIIAHDNSGTELEIGVRQKKNTDQRTVLDHESETNAYSGFGMESNTDENGTIQLFTGNSANDYFILTGYFDLDIAEVTNLYGAGFIQGDNSSYINLRWNMTGTADYFEIYHSSDGISFSKLDDCLTCVGYNHTALVNGSYHWYYVQGKLEINNNNLTGTPSSINLERVIYEVAAIPVEGDRVINWAFSAIFFILGMLICFGGTKKHG